MALNSAYSIMMLKKLRRNVNAQTHACTHTHIMPLKSWRWAKIMVPPEHEGTNPKNALLKI